MEILTSLIGRLSRLLRYRWIRVDLPIGPPMGDLTHNVLSLCPKEPVKPGEAVTITVGTLVAMDRLRLVISTDIGFVVQELIVGREHTMLGTPAGPIHAEVFSAPGLYLTHSSPLWPVDKFSITVKNCSREPRYFVGALVGEVIK